MMDMHPSIVANSEALSAASNTSLSAPLAIARRDRNRRPKVHCPRSGQNRSRHGRSSYALDLVVVEPDLFPVVTSLTNLPVPPWLNN